jgi:hypothetical protein
VSVDSVSRLLLKRKQGGQRIAGVAIRRERSAGNDPRRSFPSPAKSR